MNDDSEDPLEREIKQIDKDYRIKVFVTVLLFVFGMISGFSKVLSAHSSLLSLH